MAEFEKKIYFFGCGTVAKNIFALYKDTFNISGFITDFPEDWGKVVDGITVYSPEKILQNRNNFIVIATNKSVEKIYNRFKNLGLIPDQDFSHYEKWLRIHFENVFREKNILLQYLAECYITDRCNLKCKNCALFVPYFSKANDRDFEEVKRDISLYFKFVDRVSVFRLLGGETFLYKKLNSLLEFMGGGWYTGKNRQIAFGK